MAPFPQGAELVGPIFSLWPGFGEPDNLLLGRADFFQVFAVTFNENPSAQVFHLDF